MTSLASKADWDQLYRDKKPYGVSGKDQVAQWIFRHLPERGGATALEIGCFPGRYLPIIGALGYELHGVDMQDGVHDIPAWLDEQSLKVGEFVQADFFAWKPGKTYDVVFSLGFVEHFENWTNVIERHLEFVAPGGLLILEAPNFMGRFQNWFHRTFDAENLAIHYVPAMDPFKWAELVSQYGFEIQFAGYFGRFHLWAQESNLSPAKKIALKWLLRSRNWFKHLLPSNSKCFSPYAGLVAKRKGLS